MVITQVKLDILQEEDQNILIYNQIDIVHDHDEILDTLNQTENMFDFCEAVNIDRYKSINNIKYVVLKTTDGLHLVFFDSDGANATMQKIRFSHISNKDSVSLLKVGMALEDVQIADPDGQYDFLLHSSGNYPQISYHYFESGDCFAVRYENNVIAEILFFTL